MENKIMLKTRNIVIGFFILVFIMGFFSKSIINVFLPKVITETALDGIVEKTFDVKGIIKAKNPFKVRLSGDVIVEEYLVNVGDVVKEGQPLFRIDKGYGIRGSRYESEEQQQFYGKLDKEGIYHSTKCGVITSLGNMQSILSRDTVIVEIAGNTSEDRLVFAASIGNEDYEFVSSVGSVQILDDDMKNSMQLKITSIYKQNGQSMYTMEAAIDKPNNEQISIGQELKGVIKQSYVLKGHNKIPKSAMIAFEGYKEGKSGTVYILETSKGILGAEYRARAVQVKILAVGDNDIIVTGLEDMEKPDVILNLSYKIRDGVKVYLWQ